MSPTPPIGSGLTVYKVYILVYLHRLCSMLCRHASVCLPPRIRIYRADAPASFLPETLRSIVGDGSIQPPRFYRPLLPIIGRGHAGLNTTDRPQKKPFQNPLLLLLRLDVLILLLFNAILYLVWAGVVASISSLFSEIYPFLNETEIGLCFLAMGGGMLIGSWATGIMLDREYQKVKVQMERRCRDDPECTMRVEDVTKDENFPIEYARFRTMPVYFVIYLGACIGYGWCLKAKVNIAGPLILQFISEHLSIESNECSQFDNIR